jgi:hypothetical protein
VLRVDKILASYYRGTAMQPVMDVARLATAWADLQGEPWGSVGKPLKIHNGILWLEVPDASWGQRLAYDGRRVAGRASEFLGYDVALRHRVTPPAKVVKIYPVPIPQVGDPRVQEAVRGMEEGPLRQALQNYLELLVAYQDIHHPQLEGNKENP